MGKDKGLPVTFRVKQDFGANEAESCKEFEPTEDSKDHYDKTKAAVGKLFLNATKSKRDLSRAERMQDDPGTVDLWLVQPASFDLAIAEESCQGAEQWTDRLAVPQKGRRYPIPIPKAIAFGKQTFEIVLAPSGEITTLKYGKESGISFGLGAAATVLSPFQKETPKDAAEDLKAQADVIAQQQRLMRCRLNPSACE